MKIKMTLLASALVLALTGCGGGGGGTADAQPSSQTAQNPIDPITGSPTTGTLTNSVSGVVYGAPTTGAVVTAYSVQPDGSNGALLGTSSATGSDGKFTMTMNATPSGMVRFVATGGFYTSEADGTKQPIDTMELVTPYVTSNLNAFAITPVTHIASHALAYKASHGSTLVDAFNSSMMSVRNLAGTNTALPNDSRAIVNILKTVPNSTDDAGHAYQDLVTGLEWFGVAYDLPSKVVMRVAGAAAEGGFPLDGVNGAGAAINVGNWSGNTFNETVARTLDQVMVIPSADPNAPALHEVFKLYMSTNMIQDFYLNAACNNVAARSDMIARYPGFANFFGSSSEAGGCTGAANRLALLQAKVTSNNRANYMK